MKNIREAFSLLEDARMPEEKKQAIYRRIKKNLYQENLKRMRNRRILIKTVPLAGAAAVLVFGAVFLPGLLKADTNIVTVTQSPQHTNEIVAVLTPQPRIIYGEGETQEESVPLAGTCKLSWGVSKAVSDPSNDDALFYVEINIYDPDQTFYDTFTYEGKTVKEWGESPELREYREGFQTFSLQKDAETDWDSIKTAEDKEKYFQSIAQEWDDIWNETHEINPLAKYHEADQAYIEAVKERRKSQKENEVERLTSLGFNVKIEKTENGYFRMTGLLTKEQVINFPCEDYGYIIMWADKAECMDE